MCPAKEPKRAVVAICRKRLDASLVTGSVVTDCTFRDRGFKTLGSVRLISVYFSSNPTACSQMHFKIFRVQSYCAGFVQIHNRYLKIYDELISSKSD